MHAYMTIYNLTILLLKCRDYSLAFMMLSIQKRQNWKKVVDKNVNIFRLNMQNGRVALFDKKG